MGGSFCGGEVWNKSASEIDKCFKIYYFREGEALITDETSTFTLQAGNLYFINGYALRSYEIVIWGDGHQTRSFMYIDDCMKGIIDIMYSNIEEPINLGSSEMVSIDQLVDIVEGIAGYKLKRKYDPHAPKGARGRNSDNSLIRKYLDWEPSISLKDGLTKTYKWIKEQMIKDKEIIEKSRAKELFTSQDLIESNQTKDPFNEYEDSNGKRLL